MPWDTRAWQDRLELLSSHRADAWAPAIDVYETAAAYVVTAEVPGVARDQIDLALEDARLTLRGQRAARSTASDVLHFHQVERSHGSFARTFEFADKIDVDRVSADLSEGVLTITLPKVPPPAPRRIAVK
ncbi:MAG TPA: Hsp20/alpha crystallin family protein [Vicinamibacterales bacterium]|jgi:HSP20 family protein